jgi:hypothetical protein
MTETYIRLWQLSGGSVSLSKGSQRGGNDDGKT